MRIRNRNLAAVLLVCVAGFLSGTAADSGASRPKSGDLPQPAPAPVNPDGKGPARVLPDREAKPAGPVALPDGTSQDWWGQVQRQIAEDEYALAWRDADSAKGAAPGWSAFNRAQGFETRFSEAGIRVTPSKEGLSWTWGLSLVAWGRPGALQATGKASLHVEKNRMEVGRTGISEWFVNDERGLEQGFAIPAPPPDSALSPQHSALGGGALSPPDAVSDEAARFPRREGTPHLEPFAEASLGAGSVLPYGLCLDLALTGNLHPKFSEDGQAVDFYDGGTIAVLRYSQLKVTDATGRVLPSRFEGFSSSLLTPHSSLLIASGGGIRISINDSGAIYPITVDPLATSPAWTAESDQAGASLGFSVSSAGDVNGDGYSDVIVGAPYYDNGQTDEGRAYLYLGSASGLSFTPVWTAESDQASANFGYAVASAGDVNGDGYSDVIIGSNGYNIQTGKAYLYLGSASGLSSTATWTAESNQANAYFGCSVSSAGDVNGDGYSDVIVGVPLYDNGEVNEGRAYLYLGSASGISATSSWTAAGEATSNDFGYSVSTAGDVNGDGYSDVVVGAYGYSTSTGKAYLFLGGTAGLSTTSSWSAAGEAATNYFGRSVATAGDVNGDGYSDVLVGADGYSSSAGKAYLYLGGASGLSTTALWTAVGEATGDYFGRSAATAGDVNGDGYSDVVVGAYGNTSSTGKAYLYSGGTSGLSTFSSWTAVGEAVSNSFGYSVATAGDVNGDGYSDVVVGAYKNISDTGKAYLFQGSASGLSAASSWTAVGEAASNYFGYSVSTGGDLNRDGYSDVVVGAYGYNANYGRLYFYYGTPMGLSSSVNWIAGTAGTSFGASVASAGDVNGDGYSDVIVGSPGYSSNRGRARVYWGSPAGFTTYNTVSGEAVSNYFGASVAAAGDVNGDGYSDVVVGAHATGTNTGKAYLYLGNGEAGGGVPLRPMQYSQDGITPIAPLGLAYEKTFRIGLNLRTPVGRDLVRLEWQTVLLGGSFDAVSNPIQHESTWWNSGVTGHYRKASVSLPDEPGPYLWRARIAYFNARSPFQNHGPWFTPVANGSLETDLRSTSATAPPACVLPDEPCWLYSVIKNGTDYTLNFQDPNQSNQRTGWNIRRSNDAAPPKSTWPLVGTNVVDMDQSAPNYQWTDHSGADPGSGGVWYYQVTTYNANCPAEGPF